MQNRRSFLPIFLLFLFLSGFIFFLSSRHLLFGESFFQNILFPIQGGIYTVFSLPGKIFSSNDLTKVEQENFNLRQQLIQSKQLTQENIALHDQFETAVISTQSLLPAMVIGDPQFVPGLSAPENLIIGKGKADGVYIGDAVIYKTNVVGIITQVALHASQVILMSNKASSFTARTTTTNAQGVISGLGNGNMILGNVVLSDTLKIGDMVITNGSQDTSGKGFPPGLIIGKIISVSKNPSSLYQVASVQSLLEIQKLTTVFVLKER